MEVLLRFETGFSTEDIEFKGIFLKLFASGYFLVVGVTGRIV